MPYSPLFNSSRSLPQRPTHTVQTLECPYLGCSTFPTPRTLCSSYKPHSQMMQFLVTYFLHTRIQQISYAQKSRVTIPIDFQLHFPYQERQRVQAESYLTRNYEHEWNLKILQSFVLLAWYICVSRAKADLRDRSPFIFAHSTWSFTWKHAPVNVGGTLVLVFFVGDVSGAQFLCARCVVYLFLCTKYDRLCVGNMTFLHLLKFYRSYCC